MTEHQLNSPQPLEKEDGKKKHATIALVGAPNAGKSTLTNLLIGQKLAIISPKPQTTRNAIKGILIHDHCQLIIIDTPGIFIPRQEKILERIIVKSAWQALRSAEYIGFIIDSTHGITSQILALLNDLKKENIPIVAILNKIDAVKKPKLLDMIAQLSKIEIENIRMISALNNDGVDDLKDFFCSQANNQGWQFDEDQITDAPMKFIACEITREKLFLKLNQELPYSLAVKNDSYQIMENGHIKIHQTIFVQKESQKKIILGKNGKLIKQIGFDSRQEIAKIAGSVIHLYLFIKVKEDWMNSVASYEMIDIDNIPKQ
jgi:GTP-binding protein Era